MDINNEDLTYQQTEISRGEWIDTGRGKLKSMGSLMDRYKTMMENAKVYAPRTLFDIPINWPAVYEKKCCGYCLKPLKPDRNGPMMRCGRKRCPYPKKGGFFIRKDKLENHDATRTV